SMTEMPWGPPLSAVTTICELSAVGTSPSGKRSTVVWSPAGVRHQPCGMLAVPLQSGSAPPTIGSEPVAPAEALADWPLAAAVGAEASPVSWRKRPAFAPTGAAGLASCEAEAKATTPTLEATMARTIAAGMARRGAPTRFRMGGGFAGRRVNPSYALLS